MRNSPHGRRDWLFARVASEGYCCMKGYLELCAARGETARGMAKNFGLHRFTIYYHYRRLAEGKHPCAQCSGCMLSIIEDIKKEP